MSALVIMIIPFWICDEFGGNGRGRKSDTQPAAVLVETF